MITIITICYNSETTIRRTFDSVLDQTHLPDEYIVVDGGSKDKTLSIIIEYKLFFEKKGVIFKWISEKDNGLYDAMNKGSLMASNEWLHFLNSDDYYLNKYVLEDALYYLEKSSAQIVYGNLLQGSQRNQTSLLVIKPSKLRLYSLIGCPLYQPATYYKKNIFEKYSFDTKYKISADYKMFCELIEDKIKFEYIPIYLTFFSHGGVSTDTISNSLQKEDRMILNEFGRTTFFMRLKNTKYLRKPIILLFNLFANL